MTNPTIQITIDAREAIQAVNELTAAIEFAHAALQKLTVSVQQEPNARMSNTVSADTMVARVHNDIRMTMKPNPWSNLPRK